MINPEDGVEPVEKIAQVHVFFTFQIFWFDLQARVLGMFLVASPASSMAPILSDLLKGNWWWFEETPVPVYSIRTQAVLQPKYGTEICMETTRYNKVQDVRISEAPLAPEYINQFSE